MRRQRPLPKTGLIALAALLSCLADPVCGGASTWKPAADFVVRLDEGTVEDAKVYEDGRPRVYLVDLPSEATLFLVDLQAMTAFAIRREDAITSKSGALKTKDRFAWNAPVSWTPEGLFRFPIGNSEVRITRPDAQVPKDVATPEATVPEPANAGKDAKHPAPPPASAPPDGPASPPAAGPEARGCVSLETRPASGVPGCTRFVYVRNSCDAPVVALVQRTEHLMTGTLPQAFDTIVPPGEQWIGCAWWSGAMAPAKHELLGASYLAPPPGKRARR